MSRQEPPHHASSCSGFRCWLDAIGAQLTAGAARTPLDPPGGGRWLAVWAAAGLVSGVILLLAGGYHAGFGIINGAAAHAPDALWAWLTVLGEERLAFALLLLFALRYPRLLWALVLAGIIATLYGRGLKELCDTVRPPAILASGTFHLIGPERLRTSFPSGHSVTAGVFFGVLVYYAYRRGWRILFLTLASLAGLSRIAVGVHWPVDVAFGLAGGVLAAWLGCRLAARWPAGALHPGLHLTVVTLAAVPAGTLLFDDAGYTQAAPLLHGLGFMALASLLLHYLWPDRWRLRRGAAFPDRQ